MHVGMLGRLRWLALAALLASSPAIAQPRCATSGFEITQDTAPIAGTRMVIPAGASCQAILTGSTRGAARIDVQPQHGRVALTSQGYTYEADTNYGGVDAFRVTWFISGMTNRVGVDVAVTIVAPRNDAPPAPRGNTNAAPPPAGGPDKLGLYGALVWSRESRTFGLAVNRRTRDDAIREARRQCGRDDCRVLSPMRSDECIAFAVGSDGLYWLRRRSTDPSQDALRICRERGYTSCEIVAARCM